MYKETSKPELPKSYSKVKNISDYHTSFTAIVYCMVRLIRENAIEKDPRNTLLSFNLAKYFVKYYTKLILQYGDDEDKLYLNKVITSLNACDNVSNDE